MDTLYPLWTKADAGAVELLDIQQNGAAPIDTQGNVDTGWFPASGSAVVAAGRSAEMYSHSVRGIADFGTASTPLAPENTNGNAYRTPSPLSGTYAAGNWTFAIRVISRLAAWNGRHRFRLRVFKGPNANGSGATEITSSYTFTPGGGTQTTGGVLLTDATTIGIALANTDTRTLTWAAPQITLNNEYLFFSLALEVTTAGTTISGGRSLYLYQGAGFSIATTDFALPTQSGVPYSCGMLGV